MYNIYLQNAKYKIELIIVDNKGHFCSRQIARQIQPTKFIHRRKNVE